MCLGVCIVFVVSCTSSLTTVWRPSVVGHHVQILHAPHVHPPTPTPTYIRTHTPVHPPTHPPTPHTVYTCLTHAGSVIQSAHPIATCAAPRNTGNRDDRRAGWVTSNVTHAHSALLTHRLCCSWVCFLCVGWGWGWCRVLEGTVCWMVGVVCGVACQRKNGCAGTMVRVC